MLSFSANQIQNSVTYCVSIILPLQEGWSFLFLMLLRHWGSLFWHFPCLYSSYLFPQLPLMFISSTFAWIPIMEEGSELVLTPPSPLRRALGLAWLGWITRLEDKIRKKPEKRIVEEEQDCDLWTKVRLPLVDSLLSRIRAGGNLYNIT